jgi:hypothetical protein
MWPTTSLFNRSERVGEGLVARVRQGNEHADELVTGFKVRNPGSGSIVTFNLVDVLTEDRGCMAAGVVRHSAGVHRRSARMDSRQPRSSSKRRRTDHGCRPRRFCGDGSRRPMVGHRPCPTDPSRPRTRGGRAPLDDVHVRRSWCCPPPRRMVGPSALQGLPLVEFPPGRPLVLAVAAFAASGPRFRLLFGETNDAPPPPPPSPESLVGMGWLYALHIRSSLARACQWQAVHMLNGLRDQVVALTCLRFGLPAHQGRGVDDLPPQATGSLASTLIVSLEPPELHRAFVSTGRLLLEEAAHVDTELASRLAPPIEELFRSGEILP